MAVPVLPAALKENRSDEREKVTLINALRKQVVISGTRNVYTVGVDPGMITITGTSPNAVQFFDDNGVSLGVIQLNTFVVNP